MKIKLKELAEVQMGYSFRSRIELSDSGEISVVQMKDLSEVNTVNCDDLVKIELEDIKKQHYVQKGDLVFRSRGLLMTSAIIQKDIERAIVAGPLLRIRVSDQNKVLPEFLNWYIAQKDAQIFFASRAKGTSQKMISKAAIEELEVSSPSLERQRKIVELATLAAKEQVLLRDLAVKRELYITEILGRLAKGEMK